MITIEIGEYGNDERRFIFVDEEDFSKGTYDEEGNFKVDKNGEYQAYYDYEYGWQDEQNFDCFNVIKDYKELDRELDYYGTGYDRIKAFADDEEIYLCASRYTSGNVQNGYIFKGFV